MRQERGRLHIDSAYEADILSRAAMYGKNDDVNTSFISHENLKRTTDESEFISRVIKYGELVLNKPRATRAVQGLESISKMREPYRAVTPYEAKFFMQVLNFAPEPIPPQLELAPEPPSIEVPDFPGEIAIQRRTEQAA